MATYGVTDEGFSLKRLDAILADKQQAKRDVPGFADIDLDPESPDGEEVGASSESDAFLWELAQACFNAFDPNKAVGAVLSALVTLNFIERLKATETQVTIELTGTPATLIEAGRIVENSVNGQQYEIDADITLDGGGAGSGTATAFVTGPFTANANDVTIIVTPVSGWDTVDNSTAGDIGSDEETDPALRLRRRQSVAFASVGYIDSIFAAISNIPEVDNVTVVENDTDAISGIGQPPHSVQVVVQGGDDTELAQTIFDRKPVGIQAFGTTIIPIEDSQGIDHNIGFTRPTDIAIYIEVTVTAGPDFPGNGADLIKQNIVDYANGELVAGEDFGVGEDVIHSRLFTPINMVPDHSVDTLFISVTPGPGPGDVLNLPIAFNQISVFAIVNIGVTVI